MGLYSEINHQDVKLSGLLFWAVFHVAMRGHLPDVEYELMPDGTGILLSYGVTLDRNNVLRVIDTMWKGIIYGSYYYKLPLNQQTVTGLSLDSRKLLSLLEWVGNPENKELTFR